MDVEKLKSWDNAILIIPREDQLYFLKWKEKYPSLSFQMFTKEDILDNYYGKEESNAFYLWYQKHPELSYAIAQLYFSKATKLYHSVHVEKVEEIKKVREELLMMKFHQESNIHLLIREDLLYLFYKDCVIGRHPIIQVILNIR